MWTWWQWYILSVAALVTGGLMLLWLLDLHRLRQDFFFLFFCTTTVVYLEVVPALAQLSEYVPQSIFLSGLPPPQAYRAEYAWLMVAVLLLFQLPLAASYFLRRDEHTEPSRLVARANGARFVAAVALIFALLALRTVTLHNLFFTRIGSQELAQVIVGLPWLDFVVFRTYQEMALFVIGVLLFIVVGSRGLTRGLATVAFLTNLALFGYLSVRNSRWSVILFLVCLVGWWFRVRPRPVTPIRQLAAVAATVLAAAYLSTVVVNLRKGDLQAGLGVSALSPGEFGVFADSQGLNRLDGLDLMARLAPVIQSQGPAWGEAWQSQVWLVRRFFDPAGFDRFRLSLATSAKNYLISRYLGRDLPDYFSCALTDLFGNFHVAGFLVAAVAFAAGFLFWRGAWSQPRSGAQFLVGLFVLTHILIFDQQAESLLFGWTKKLIPLLLIVAARPLTVVAEGIPRNRGT